MSNNNLLVSINKLDLICIKKTYICLNINKLKIDKMSDFKQKPGFGSIFKNDYKNSDNQPDYKGKILLKDGTEQQIALWIKEGANGKFFSAALSDIYVKVDTTNDDDNNDLPF
jgi:hypothetical protein